MIPYLYIYIYIYIISLPQHQLTTLQNTVIFAEKEKKLLTIRTYIQMSG